MSQRAWLQVPEDAIFAALVPALTEAGFETATDPPACIGVFGLGAACDRIRAAERLASETSGNALAVFTLGNRGPGWVEVQDNALLWAFTRHAALSWARRGIRVNALGLGVSLAALGEAGEDAGRGSGPVAALPATAPDVARAVLTLWRLRSMTGQLIRLGAP